MPSRDYLLGRRDMATDARAAMNRYGMEGRRGDRMFSDWLDGQIVDLRRRLRRKGPDAATSLADAEERLMKLSAGREWPDGLGPEDM